MRIKRSKDEWASLLREQKESGKSITAFCRAKGIHPNLFSRKAKMMKENGTFIQVAVPAVHSGSIEIRTGNVKVIMPCTFSKEELIKVLQCVRESDDA